MGIRINKQMGWILQGENLDLTPLKGITLNDLKKMYPNDTQLQKIDLIYPKSILDLDTFLIEFVNCIDSAPETDENETIYCFIPPGSGRDWHRSDDSIDYYETNSGGLTKIQKIHREVFPHSNRFIVTETLQELSNSDHDLAKIADGIKLSKELTIGLSKLGIKTNKKVSPQLHMRCPKVIELILKICNESIDPKRLYPGIITYWI